MVRDSWDQTFPWSFLWSKICLLISTARIVLIFHFVRLSIGYHGWLPRWVTRKQYWNLVRFLTDKDSYKNTVAKSKAPSGSVRLTHHSEQARVNGVELERFFHPSFLVMFYFLIHHTARLDHLTTNRSRRYVKKKRIPRIAGRLYLEPLLDKLNLVILERTEMTSAIIQVNNRVGSSDGLRGWIPSTAWAAFYSKVFKSACVFFSLDASTCLALFRKGIAMIYGIRVS